LVPREIERCNVCSTHNSRRRAFIMYMRLCMCMYMCVYRCIGRPNRESIQCVWIRKDHTCWKSVEGCSCVYDGHWWWNISLCNNALRQQCTNKWFRCSRCNYWRRMLGIPSLCLSPRSSLDRVIGLSLSLVPFWLLNQRISVNVYWTNMMPISDVLVRRMESAKESTSNWMHLIPNLFPP